MQNIEKRYPNLNWNQFAMCNDDATTAFEDMTRRLFTLSFLDSDVFPHSNHNNPGIEVLPIMEKERGVGLPRRVISFQAKYFRDRVDYNQISKSMSKAIKYYGKELDLIYLFCNKTLTTTNSNYIKIAEMLAEHGIELYPITDREILDMVASYLEVAVYFFLPRVVPDNMNSNQIDIGGIIKNGHDNTCVECPMKHNIQTMDPELFKKLISEKIQTCKSYITKVQFDSLRKEIDTIFEYSIEAVDGAEKLFFYRGIIDLYDDKELEESIIHRAASYSKDLEFLKKYFDSPGSITAYTFASYCVESQIVLLDKMFSAQLWNEAVNLCKEIVKAVPSDISDIVRQYYGLAAFNLQDYSLAEALLEELYQENHSENTMLYMIFAKLKSINRRWREGDYEKRDTLIELLSRLHSLNNNVQYRSNEKLVAMLYLETGYNLGMQDKKSAEKILDIYGEITEETKKDEIVKYLYALCLEINGKLDEAENIYSDLDWENDSSVACRYLICKLSKEEYEEVIKIYHKISIDACNSKIKSLYLTALYNIGQGEYEDILITFLAEVESDFEQIIDIALGICEKDYLQKYIIPLVAKHIDVSLDNLSFMKKTELLLFLANAENIECIKNVLMHLKQVNCLNQYVGKKIYHVLFEICHNRYLNKNDSVLQCKELEDAEWIADYILSYDFLKGEFLQIKFLCVAAKNKKISMLKYAKLLFEVTHDEETANNIITMLFERNEKNYEAYAPYVDVLVNSTNPKYCITVAYATLLFGKKEEADLSAYKALYYLNGTEDYDIFKKVFGYYHYFPNRCQEIEKLNRVRGSAVVVLEKISENDEKKFITVCIDSEKELVEQDNISMAIKHINCTDPIFFKFQGSALKQVIKIGGTNYRITDIKSRMDYAIRYIFEKIMQYPEQFKELHVLEFEEPEKMIDKMLELTKKDNQLDHLMDLYHFKENDIGIPIDAMMHGNYERYIDAFKMLLYAKDQAFYAGQPIDETDNNQQYVLSLSTLVLLSTMDLLFILEEIKEKIIIPASYFDFFLERYTYEKTQNEISPGKFINVDNQLALIKNDEKNVEIWEKIIDFCEGCKKIDVSDEERINLTLGSDISGEQFVEALQLDLIHLDAFALAKGKEATLVCDDLFFRKFAAYGKIKNINVIPIIRNYSDENVVVSVLMDLSKTNYIYIPLIARTNEEAHELRKNILDGELKKQYYQEILERYNIALKNFIKNIFGEESMEE